MKTEQRITRGRKSEKTELETKQLKESKEMEETASPTVTRRVFRRSLPLSHRWGSFISKRSEDARNRSKRETRETGLESLGGRHRRVLPEARLDGEHTREGRRVERVGGQDGGVE